MKNKFATLISLGTLAFASSAHAAGPYYWDTDGEGTPGFGTASGTWGSDPFWSLDSTGGGAIAPTNATIAAGESANFGSATDGLGAGTVNGPASAITLPNITFGAASGAILLSGGTFNMTNGTGNTITVNNATDTISSVFQGGNASSSITKSGTGTLVLSGASTFIGNVLINGGTLSVDSIGDASAAQALGKGSLIQLGFGTVTGVLEVTGNTNSSTDKQIRVGRQNNQHTAGATILNNGGGSLTFTNSTFNASVATGTNVARLLTLGGTYSGGTNVIQGIIQNGVSTNVNSLEVTGSTWQLSGTNTYTGTTTVSGGKLLINGSTISTSDVVSVNAGGTLGGTGRVGGAISVATNGILSPGASIESLAANSSVTMAANSTFAYEIANNTSIGADLLAVNGTLTLSGVILSFDLATLAALEGGGWTNNDKLTLISYSGTALTSGFNGYNDDTTYSFAGNDWIFNYDDTTAGGNYAGDAVLDGQTNFITMTYSAVPEPGTASLLGVVGVAILLRRRR